MHEPAPPPSALVGRDREIVVLREHLTAALAGRGSLVLIGGEAGIGKTALAEAICGDARAQGALVLVGRCYDRSETPPYGPFLELLRGYLPADGLPPAPFPQWGRAGAAGSRAARSDQLLDFFRAVASRRPFALFFDDLHWADQASLDLLRVLARSVHTLPLLLLITYRADELTRHHPLRSLLPLLDREAAATRLALRPLPAGDVQALIAARYNLAAAEAARLVGYLDARAEGNALFVTQLLRALEEEKVLAVNERGWELGDLSRRSIPLPLIEVIDTRIARLADAVQGLLAVAAVLGQEVPLALWGATADVMDEEVLIAVEEATAARLLEATTDGTAVRFVHALIREAAYAGILPPRRRQWHRKAADVLIAVPGVDPDTVAYHLRQASDPRAVVWLVQAGERAQRAGADLTAIDRYDAALALMDLAHVGETEERAWLLVRLAHAHQLLDPHASVSCLEASARIAAEGHDRALSAVVMWLAHCFEEDLGRGVAGLRDGLAALDTLPASERQRAEVALGRSTDRMRGTLILYLAVSGHSRESVTLADRMGGPHALSDGSWFLGPMMAHAMLGDPQRCEEPFLHTCAVDRAARRYGQLGFNYLLHLELIALPYHGDDLPARRELAKQGEGAWQQARVTNPDLQPPEIARLPLLLMEGHWDDLARLIPALHVINTRHQAVIKYVAGPFARLRGDPEGAWLCVHRILPQGTATAPGGTILFVALAMQRLAAALSLDTGDLPGAKAWIDAHDRWLEWSESVLGASEGAALWARYHRMTGDTPQALADARSALALASEPRQPLALLAADRLIGEVEMERGNLEAAGEHLDRALALAEACAAPFERALTLLALTEQRAATGEHDAAQQMLDEARAICTRLGAKPVLAHADALTDRLYDIPLPSPSPAYPAGLSTREVEVLRLVASGRTNREIADTLFLSERTIQVHVRNILTKTNTGNRTAAAAFAREQHLA